MHPVRSTLLALLVAAAALAPGARPAHAAPLTQHTITVMVTSVEVVDSLDHNACGEFHHLKLKANTGSGWKAANLLPKGAEVEYWSQLGVWFGTFSLCEGTTYPVAQTDLPALAASWASWNGTGLFTYEPIETRPMNRFTVAGRPDRPVTLASFLFEEDPLGGASVERVLEVKAPGAGENTTFTMGLDSNGTWGATTALILRGVVSTSATPTS